MWRNGSATRIEIRDGAGRRHGRGVVVSPRETSRLRGALQQVKNILYEPWSRISGLRKLLTIA